MLVVDYFANRKYRKKRTLLESVITRDARALAGKNISRNWKHDCDNANFKELRHQPRSKWRHGG
jgi:hypothetical protein